MKIGGVEGDLGDADRGRPRRHIQGAAKLHREQGLQLRGFVSIKEYNIS